MANIISLFSGCGGLDLGFEQVGDYTTVWANDFKHEACVTFRNHFGDIIVEGDIEQIDPYNNPTIPDCDLILGGFPCQDFSIIWKQPGLNGERGNLYKSFLRFVDAKKPKAFVAENVKGILTANKKKAIEQIIKGEFYQFNLSSCIRQQNSLTAQFVSFSLSNLANIFYPPPIFTIINLCLL